MLVYIAVNICMMMIFIYFSDSLLPPRFSEKIHRALLSAAVLLCAAYVIAYDFYVQDTFSAYVMVIRVFALSAAYMCVLFLLYRDRLCRVSAVSALCLFLNVCSNAVTSAFYLVDWNGGELPLLGDAALQAGDAVLATGLTQLALMTLLAWVTARYLKKIPPELPARYWYTLTLLECVILLATGVLWDILLTVPAESLLYIYAAILFLGLMCAGILAIVLFGGVTEFYTRRQQFILLAAQNDALAQRLETEHSLNESLRGFKHEMNSLLTAVYALLENQKYDEAKRTVSEKIELLAGSDYESYTENYMIDALLNYKTAHIKKLGIPLKTQLAHLSPELAYDPADVCSILLNLLDNAIEANMRMEKSAESRYIYIKICTYKQYVCIIIKNAYSGGLRVQNGQLATSKADGWLHGCGLKNIGCAVDKYSGIFDYSYSNGEFTAKVMLPV